MNLDQVNEVMAKVPKGANVVLEWERDAKTKKGAPRVRKAVRMVGRVGVKYDNLKSVFEKRSNGELPEENQGETWWEWVKYPFLTQHKKNTGQKYVRLYNGTSKNSIPRRQFKIDGKNVSFEEVEPYLYATEKERGHGDTFMVKIEDVLVIHYIA